MSESVPPEAPETETLEKLESIPDWLNDLYHDIDAKEFDTGFDCFAQDAEMVFGVYHAQGRNEIKSTLKEFDEGMETNHLLKEIWDGPRMKVARGVAELTDNESGETIESPFIQMYYMSGENPNKIQHAYIVAGPV